MNPLKPLPNAVKPSGPVVLIIMDGVGIGHGDPGDMVAKASKPNMDWLKANAPHTCLKAHGTAVGMPTDADMGNSEVGHNAIGAGRVFAQGASLVLNAIRDESIFAGATWKELIENSSRGGTLHFIGLLSDGNVHSHIEHLEAMLRQARKEGIRTVRLHALLDGRDVPPTSALEYVDRIEALLAELSGDGFDYAIASGGGRQFITMDRYNANWAMVQRGWQTHVLGEGRKFASARQAIETYRKECPGVIDQDLSAFVIARKDQAIGPIQDGDGVILFNFRGDRAMELCAAFEKTDFDKFDRVRHPQVTFAGMMEYDGDLHIPSKYLVNPPAISHTMGEYLAATGLKQLAVSETQKYGHVTYFFNGNRTGKFDEKLEDYVEIKSDVLPFEQRPWMKAGEITDVVLKAIRENSHDFIRVNYPNGDMVGHTGDLLAVEISVEAVDLGLGRLMAAARETGAILVITADHGNADEMLELDKNGNLVIDKATGLPQPKTCHTLNPVPCYFYDPSGRSKIKLSAKQEGLGISSLAATCIHLLGYEVPKDYSPSILTLG